MKFTAQLNFCLLTLIHVCVQSMELPPVPAAGGRMSGLSALLLLLCCVSLAPGSPHAFAVSLRARRLCGVHLVDALLFVCGDRGLFYQPGRRVREEDIRIMMDNVPSVEKTRVAQANSRGGPTVSKRGIVEQCCHFYCDFYDLENYCNNT
ncbi:insulin [Alosa sapidissima]|uniref:insulin n=1 Tax=Alosa sapidissima TaxID=34773 RepID=UPI001C097E2F|nr:insulin [Alosa sapidissima]